MEYKGRRFISDNLEKQGLRKEISQKEYDVTVRVIISFFHHFSSFSDQEKINYIPQIIRRISNIIPEKKISPV